MFTSTAPHLDHLSVGKHHFHRHDVVAGHAVFQAMRAARIEGHIAADRTNLLAARIGSIVESGLFNRCGQLRINDPRFDHCLAIGQVYADNPIESIQGNDHSISVR